MKRLIHLVVAVLLTGCGLNTGPLGGLSADELLAMDAASLGGLSYDVAARPSVQLARPTAFALTAEARPFLDALEATVVPERQTLAARLRADPSVSTGLARWEASSRGARLSVLKRIAAIQAEVMGAVVPSIVEQDRSTEASSLLAMYQPVNGGAGEILLYTDTLAKETKYALVATMVHEMRHAVQYQLIQHPGPHDTLARAYADAVSVVEAAGGQAQFSYGDYAHLNVEYDAFQTGNQVATAISGGTYDAMGNGFVDVQYRTVEAPILNLLALAVQLSGTDLIAAVNRAQYEAERGRGVQVPRQRHPGFRRR